MPHALRRSESLAGFALGCLALGSAAAQEPAQWLARMDQALTTRNYDGTFSHWQGGQVEMLRIVHRVQDGTVSERLASLDGSGREFIRTGASLACYLPDKRTVVVQQRPQGRSLVGFPAITAQPADYYTIKEVARVRFNQRDTHLINVIPKDEFRYGYRLWIDHSTAMPLKTQLCDAHGQVIEQIVFASLTLAAKIPDAAFRPAFSTDGFQWVRDAKAALVAPAADSPAWNALRLPPGFQLSLRAAQTLPGSTQVVDHLVFTDGVASVSVFVEHRESTVSGAPAPAAADVAAEQAPAGPEVATVGSSSAFSTMVDGHKVTAVGEVPPQTVQFIATQVKAQALSTGGGATAHN